jgi:hypothetical protein
LPRRPQVPQIGRTPSHRVLRSLHCTQAIWILRRLALRVPDSGSWLFICGKMVVVGRGHVLEWTIEESRFGCSPKSRQELTSQASRQLNSDHVMSQSVGRRSPRPFLIPKITTTTITLPPSNQHVLRRHRVVSAHRRYYVRTTSWVWTKFATGPPSNGTVWCFFWRLQPYQSNPSLSSGSRSNI